MKEKIYISGKITGLELEDAKLLFNRAELECRAMGLIPINPMRLNHSNAKCWSDYMRTDIKALMDCKFVYALTNCIDSKGSKLELDIAHELGIDIIYSKNKIQIR